MAKLITTMPWSRTPLGAIESWPQSLRTAVSLTQASNSPISLAWGEGHVQIYNDGYWPICGAKHPGSMGQDFRECWASAFPVIGDAYATAWSGKSAYLEKMRMFLDRYGFLEETWFTFSFSPITDESGRVGGLFHPVTELTAQMLSERRTKTLRDLASRTGNARTIADAYAVVTEVLGEYDLDLPFVLLYAIDGDGRRARLTGRCGIAAGTRVSPEVVELDGGVGLWSIGEVASTAIAAQLDAASVLDGIPVGPYEEYPKMAFALPIAQPGSERPAAVMIAGVSARLRLDEAYRSFYDLVAAAIGGSLGAARAYEEERERAEKLAEIDRAKTAFFSNVSHEFRTPLTLILGPVQDALARDRGALEGDDLAAVHRNAVRLLALVNSLLEFSRVESSRLKSAYEATDLAALTSGLAGSFSSLLETAGLALVSDCAPLPEPVFVDRSQWETIVLNLVSNAFKFTFEGSITVRLRAVDGHAELSVSDTGTGIPEPELPRIFERFHRVDGARGRSFEGTGIGLALVKELVGLHGGTIAAASAVGRGTTFTIAIPFGRAHLPEDRIGNSRPLEDSHAPSRFLLEAEQWQSAAAVDDSATPSAAAHDETLGRVLVADDNTDMREYIVRLLQPQWEVEAVADGEVAFQRIRERAPDLVLSDVMMPRMDGFALVQAIREEPSLRTLPVILLSARAGEEAIVGGIGSGADDYLVKPFSARELLGRVRTHVQLARMRRDAEAAATELAETRAALLADLARKNKELEAFSYSVSHDLRAPLRSIDGFSKALLEDYSQVLDDTGRDYLGRVGAAARRMGELIDDLLLLAKVSRGDLDRTRVDVSTLARAVVTELDRREPERDIVIAIEDGITVDADARLLRVLYDNLVANAWKFTGKTAHARVDIGTMKEDGETVLFVRDNGAGFDMAYAAKLFKPFQRLHRESDFSGTGIGLATVTRIVERHGGRVWARGEVGRGATIYFTMPVR